MCQAWRSGTSLVCTKGQTWTHTLNHTTPDCTFTFSCYPHVPTESVVPGNRQERMNGHPCLWQAAQLSQQIFSLCLTSIILLAESSPQTMIAPQICFCNPSTEQSLRDRVIPKNHNSAWSDTGEWTHSCCILPYTTAVKPPQAWIRVSGGVPWNKSTYLDCLNKVFPLGTNITSADCPWRNLTLSPSKW